MDFPANIKAIIKIYRTRQIAFGRIAVHDLLKYIYELHAKIDQLETPSPTKETLKEFTPYPREESVEPLSAEELGQMVVNMPLHWSLEHVSDSGPHQWCVYDTDDGRTLAGSPTPQEALRAAAENPLSMIAAKYLPRYAWSLVGKKFRLM